MDIEMKKPHILVVEDDAEMRETLSDILSEEGYEVKTTKKGKEALALAREEKEKFPLAICLIDLKLPDISGIKVLRELKELNPESYAIIMTAFASKETAIEALKAGAYSYIEKPVNMEELLHIIKRASESYQLLEEKKQAEDMLRESEAKYMDLYENANDIIYIHDLQGRFTSANRAAYTAFGYQKEDIQKLTIFDVLLPDDAKFAREITQRMVASKSDLTEEQPWEFKAVRKDGGILDIEVHTRLLREKEKIVGIQGIARDITERKRAEEEIRQAEKEWRDSFNSLADVMIVANTNFTIERVNKAAEELVGKTKEEIIGMKCYKVFHNIDSPPKNCPLKKSLKTKKVETVERYEQKFGRYFSEKSSPILNENGEIIKSVYLMRDITERKRAEKEVKKYTKELERVNRDLEDFTSTVSHDLRAPLRSIQAFTMLLMEDYADVLDETGRGYLNKVKEAVERMSVQIEDLLTLSRVGRKFIEVETVDLNELLEEIKIDLSARIEERGGEIVVGKLPPVSTQRVWMKQLLTNLIDNGLKFNRAEKPRVVVSCEEREKDYLFTVKDNGIGIEEKHMDSIFNLFERLHSSSEYEGTGAGLAICKKIAEELGGDIWVESKPGEGSTFFFTIPRTKNKL